MKVLVTGGAGFIGSNVCQRFVNKGHEVICLDNLSTGYKNNMLEFMYNPLFHFIIHDITEPFPAANVDAVIHCATPDLKDPLHFLKTCSYGIFNVAGMARRNNAKLICISGDSIYGSNLACGSTEDEVGILSPADTLCVGHQAMESILNNYKTLDVRIVRLFNTYGPKMSRKHILHVLIKDIISKKTLNIPFNPKTVLNFCFIADILDGISCTFDLAKDKFNSPINLASENQIYLDEFVSLVKEETESVCNVSYISEHRPSEFFKQPNIEKAKKVLHWSQKVDYKKGIKAYIEYIRQGRNED